jgi:hypothetical protein
MIVVLRRQHFLGGLPIGRTVMPAPLVPHANIPTLAHQITSDQRAVLAEIQRAGFIRNHDLDEQTAAVLQELTKLGLVDPAYVGPTDGPVYLWTSNGNGQRVLRYLTGIRSGPHYELPADELAAWLEAQGNDRWWSVDGDPLLTGQLDFPCPADELAAELRQIGLPLLVQARKEDTGAKGQRIDRDKLDAIVGKITDNLHLIREGQLPAWSSDRLLYLCWKGSTNDWLLCEDSEAAKQMQANDGGKAVEAADVKKE